MRISVGCDVVYVPRVADLSKSGALEKILSPAEIVRSTHEHIAGLIALKEAAIKALDLSADDWLKITIKRSGNKPVVDLYDQDDSIASIDCSVSHDEDYAFAVVTVLYR